MNWIEISDAASVNALKAESAAHPGRIYIIFKHSTRCSTSRMAKNLFESEWTVSTPVHLIKVVESRQASDCAASVFGVRYESPQVLVIQNAATIHDSSHSMIDATGIIRIMQSEPA
jgi:bacillithiol system protein YtxJ